MCNQGCIAPGNRPMWSATLIGINFLAVTAPNSTVATARMLARPLFPAEFWPCLSQSAIERVNKQFPLLYHNFWLKSCTVADDYFVTLSVVLDEVI